MPKELVKYVVFEGDDGMGWICVDVFGNPAEQDVIDNIVANSGKNIDGKKDAV